MAKNINNIETNFTGNLQHLMQKAKIKSVELAGKIGVSAELIAKLKKGSLNNPTLKVLSKISRHFNISIEDLAFGNIDRIGDLDRIRSIKYIPIYAWQGIDRLNEQNPKHFFISDSIQSSNDIIGMYVDQNYKIFDAGSVVFIEKSPELKNNSYVIVSNNYSKALTINQVIIEDCIYLKSLILDGNINKYEKDRYTVLGSIVSYQKFFI